jgi:hypothetical protein
VAWVSLQAEAGDPGAAEPKRRLGPCAQLGTAAMEGAFRYLIGAALVAVLLVLLAGLWNMTRGTSPNLSQTLMRWRVGLQFLAIVIIMLVVYIWRS